MEQEFEEGFYSFVRKEAKEYVCVNCGTYSLNPIKHKYISLTEAKVTLKCKQCETEREAIMQMFD
ncbi:hypothetical protein J40TS1_00240 [Paenibacillus montaniterrae]|uniref:Uncharacterized protein n=1 Tax=Paenibacillus montaniterrae TaxID=429341 RepID=A0A919YJC1_9BACL|nr:hypothetical protein J40TS1_00240 [Paenibacillus montaniterrae]